MPTSYTHQEQAGMDVHLWPEENRHPHYKTLTHNKNNGHQLSKLKRYITQEINQRCLET
jgi:hypothetical protein